MHKANSQVIGLCLLLKADHFRAIANLTSDELIDINYNVVVQTHFCDVQIHEAFTFLLIYPSRYALHSQAGAAAMTTATSV